MPTPAAARIPTSDAEVVERLPTRAGDPAARELLELRAAWRRSPSDIGIATALAQHYAERGIAEGDPRHFGHAQAALQRWWDDPAPPPKARTLRAVLLQFDHRFDQALGDLRAVVQAHPDDAQAWAWITAIELVRLETDAARQACERLAALSPPLVGAGCRAQLDALAGRAEQGARRLRDALSAHPGADAGQRVWALTRLGEIEHHRGQTAAAEAAFRAAIALGPPDVYLLAACADLLFDAGRHADVLELLQGRTRPDVLLLRLALAAQATRDARAPGWIAELSARFDAARARGDSSHRKEEARFALALQQQPARALELARANWAQQRELADARILLEAALAARQPQAAQPVLRWMDQARIDSVPLQALAARLKALP